MDRNNLGFRVARHSKGSLSARRAWIEITVTRESFSTSSVALRKESVDRNIDVLFKLVHGVTVALRKESVDRNFPISSDTSQGDVALRKESVDRNFLE